MNFSILPNLIALSILVVVFWAILRQAPVGQRLHLWLAGWILVLFHFAAEFVDPGTGLWNRIATAVSLDALILASVAFLIAVSRIAPDRRRQILLALAIAVPTFAYTNGVIWEIASRNYYYCWIAIGLAAPLALFCRYYPRISSYAVGVVGSAFVVALSTVWAVAHNKFDLGIDFILAALNFAVAILYWKRYRRATAGILTTVAGFVLWGAVFPVSILIAVFLPSAKVESEVWNIPKYLVAVGMILTLLEDQIEKTRYLAYHDELTGLPNRRLLDDRLDQALAHAARNRSKVAVLLLDLDRFKEVNDTFGHRVGDVALREVTARLAGSIRASDTLARSGGDEFTVVSYVADLEGAMALLSSLESALAVPLSIEGRQVQTGLSVGLALYPDDGINPDQLHAVADRAMYVAKRAARGADMGVIPRSGTFLSTFEQGV